MRKILKPWVIEALQFYGGKAYPKDVCKYIWNKYKSDIENLGDALYTWQYDIRWAAQNLRNNGILKPVNNKRNKPWELSELIE